MENLLAKYFSGDASKSEQEEVLKWRNASEDNSKAFLEQKIIWLESAKAEQPDPSLLEAILADTEQTVEVLPIWKSNFFRFAASILIILGVGLAIYQSTKSPDLLQPAFAEVSSQTLPDGTLVSLHKGATLTIENFDNVRAVRLKGKAYFDVKRDESKPFIIYGDAEIVEVLGTSFVVNTNTSEVQVESGVVAFSTLDGTDKVELQKGEMGVLSNSEQKIKKSEIEDVNYLSWKTRKIAFRKSDLATVSKVLEDVYDVSISFENPNLSGCLLTATFNEKNISEIAAIITETFDLKSEITSNSVTFFGEGCQ